MVLLLEMIFSCLMAGKKTPQLSQKKKYAYKFMCEQCTAPMDGVPSDAPFCSVHGFICLSSPILRTFTDN